MKNIARLFLLSLTLPAALACSGPAAPLADAGTDASASPSLAGMWRSVQPGAGGDQTLTETLTGNNSAGTFTLSSIDVSHTNGCTTTANIIGTYTVTGASFTPAADSGTQMVAGCTDPANDSPSMPIDSGTLGETYSATLTMTLTATQLTLGTLVFTRI